MTRYRWYRGVGTLDPRSRWVPPQGPVGAPVAMGNSTKGSLYTNILQNLKSPRLPLISRFRTPKPSIDKVTIIDRLTLPHRWSWWVAWGTGGLRNPRPWRGRCRAGYSNTGGPPLPRKRAPLQKGRGFIRPPIYPMSPSICSLYGRASGRSPHKLLSSDE